MKGYRGQHHILGVRHPTISKKTFGKPGGTVGQRVTGGKLGGYASFTAPRNRASSSTIIPRGGHKASPGSSTIPKLPKQMSVKDILHIKFPGKR